MKILLSKSRDSEVFFLSCRAIGSLIVFSTDVKTEAESIRIRLNNGKHFRDTLVKLQRAHGGYLGTQRR